MRNIQKKFSIAIDGPCATGKSCTAKLIAEKLSIVYIDTGAMYRACAYYFINNNIDINEENVKKYMDKINIQLDYINNNIIVLLNSKNITSKIRTPEISMGASNISKFIYVREKMVDIQRKMCLDMSVVMDGRDIGSVVLPNADLKVYLDADCEVRAKRRQKDLEKKGEKILLEKIKKELSKRDYQDMNRKNSPLIKVKDAIVIDNTNMTAEEVADKIISLINKKI